MSPDKFSALLGKTCLIIAEVAQAHDGSLGNALAYIDAIAKAGADAVKFQTHIAAAESTPHEPWRVRFSPQDDRRYDYWKRMEFTEAQWNMLARHAEDKGLIFLSTPFSEDAVDLLERVGVPAWKVGSGDITNRPMIERLATSGKAIILSSGMSTWEELDVAVTTAGSGGSKVAVMQCTTSYPCPPERVGLNVIDEIRARYDCPVGLSDHSGTIYPGLAAVALGASIIEVHVVFSRECFGPDTPASVTTQELSSLVEGARVIRKSLDNPVVKDQEAKGMSELRSVFGRSLVARVNLRAGTLLERKHIAFKKPGGGISPDRVQEFVGKSLLRDVPEDTILTEDLFELS